MRQNSLGKFVRMLPTVILVSAIFLSGCTVLAGCAKQKEKGEITSADQLNSSAYTVGVPEAGAALAAIEEACPEAELKYYSRDADAYLAVQQGKIDAFAFDRVMMEFAIGNGLEGVRLLPENVGEGMDIVVGISPKTKLPNLTDSVNRFLEELRAEGILDDMYCRWVIEADNRMPDLPVPESPALTLKVGTTGLVQPFSYYEGDRITGYDVEMIYRFAYFMNADVEILAYDYGGIMAAAESGSIDCIMANLNATEERRKQIAFSDPIYQSYTAVMIPDAGNGSSEGSGAKFSGLASSFERTFITENRWKLILNGLGITVVISVFSGLVGSLFGFGVCLLRRSKIKPAAALTAAFIRIIQGTPIVVLLMILYYVIFAPFRDISAVLVAVIGFSINFGVYISEMMRTGIDAVDKGQIEAAVALGYNRRQAFCKVTFPQAARHFLPVFKGEFISMVKMTSVVGYIAVQDLTKVSDIIRSRTLEAFFPLIATAVIYFIIANVLTMVLSLIEMNLDPKRRKGILKGVEKR